MAIKFVDVEPDDGKERKAKAVKPDRASPSPRTVSEPAAPPVPSAPPPAVASGDGVLPGLAHAKPEPKARGRRTPAASEAVAKSAVSDRSEAKDATETLPGLPVHAKPAPKPRGRKKAFG